MENKTAEQQLNEIAEKSEKTVREVCQLVFSYLQAENRSIHDFEENSKKQVAKLQSFVILQQAENNLLEANIKKYDLEARWGEIQEEIKKRSELAQSGKTKKASYRVLRRFGIIS